ncbi:MAG: hypothetical protein US97_C0007G0002 [Microgenomates group bacterium GW2011_GWF1_38_5]|nr:MAG: hypothetical protein US97_C0007G0002 [Microgenomates group bacterium GW2011_GWF1_38_5]
MNTMDSRKITIEEVKKIAQMSKLNIEGVTGLTNVYQDGSQKVTLPREDALKNVKETARNLVVTKGVFDRE